MRLLALVGLLLAGAATADDMPDTGCLGHQSAGDDCLTENGTPGTCIELRSEVQRHPKAPITIQINLVCQAAVARAALPWVGAGLGFLALVAALVFKPRRPTLSPA